MKSLFCLNMQHSKIGRLLPVSSASAVGAASAVRSSSAAAAGGAAGLDFGFGRVCADKPVLMLGEVCFFLRNVYVRIAALLEFIMTFCDKVE